MGQKNSPKKNYEFSWDVLDVIIGGKSMLDQNRGLIGFPMQSLEDADRFMKSYGFDMDDPIEKAEVLGNYHEALNFIRKNFLRPENPEGLDLEIPRKIVEINDIRDLLLMASMSYPGQASDTEGNLLKEWSCGLMKVVHTIAHLDKDVRYSYIKEIQQQIFDRYYKAIHRTDDGNLYLGESADDPNRITLAAFDTKSKKARESVLLKLLHKPESVADEIFDRVGMRFVTNNRLDTIRVVKYLKDSMILMPVNIKPSRSRNQLVDMPAFQKVVAEAHSIPEFDEASLASAVEKLDLPNAGSEEQNPHTDKEYRSIQFTSRQLIKLRNPVYENVRELRGFLKKKDLDEDIVRVIEGIDMKYMNREIRFFYPYEVQIVDKKTHDENEKGRSAHGEYKKSQMLTAMKRVMGNLVNRKAGGIA